MFTFARTSQVCGIILPVEGVCVCGRWWDSQQWKREKNRRVFVCVCNLRAILFVKYENPLFFVCKCVSLCLCMFWVGVHSSGYLEIVCRFVFHTIVILVSFIFSPSFLSFLLFFYCYYHLLHWFRTISSQMMYPIGLQRRDLTFAFRNLVHLLCVLRLLMPPPLLHTNNSR